MLKIGNLVFNGFAALAPMAGAADSAMRRMCIKYGAGFCVSELISAKAITMGDKKTLSMLKIGPLERPMAIQLFGNDPEVMARAAQKAAEFSPEFIDINMGCPAPKVANNNGGCSLMKDPRLAGEIVSAVVRAVHLPVTVKMRAGWDEQSINAVEIAKRCEDAGAAAVTVHGRTRTQMYAPPVNFEIIGQVKQAVKIPVIGNGDITCAKDAKKMYEETGCDYVMVGRGALGAPWIFEQINEYLKTGKLLPDPPVEKRMQLLLEQVKVMIELKGEQKALKEARKHASWYIKGMRGASEFRRRCGGLETYSQLEALCEDIIKYNS
ncbi:MAG TPA: tRNA dihydrouridine synthase DusB [Clostridiales bacterium]|nr:tRNA dihydrouridine synthase DusB [Clostridiales bacterium]